VARRTRVKPETGPSALARETALIGEIRRAQAAGRYAEVVLFTGQHAKRFPKGAFADERSLARARALCRLGKTSQARKVSDRFVRKHPNSHLVPQFEAICSE
jgi:outer membrane protein assembly factor BamD (BamD/ComL family)